MEDGFGIWETVYWLKLFAVTGMLLSTMESLARGREYKDDQIFSWKVIKTKSLDAQFGLFAGLWNMLLRYPNFLVILLIRVGALLALYPPALPPGWEAALLLVVLLTTLIYNYRSPYGQDGSDQMLSIITVNLFLISLMREKILVVQACLWFVALQLVLSYVTAGCAKLLGDKWRRGVAVTMIFNTRSYGMHAVSVWLHRHPVWAKWLTWSVIGMEILFPLIFFTPAPYYWIFMVWGISFHLLTALIMGLNSFLWGFLAAYFPLLYCIGQVRGWL